MYGTAPAVFLVILSVISLQNGIARANTDNPSDAVMIERLILESVGGCLDDMPSVSGATVFPLYRGAVPPSAMIRNDVESLLTTRGATITDTRSSADIIVTLSLSEAHTICIETKSIIARTATVTLHLHATVANETVFARMIHRTATDSFPPSLRESTDDTARVSPKAGRTFIPRPRSGFSIVSFGILTLTLIYFAFS